MSLLLHRNSTLWKPPLGTRINQSHPLAKGLVGAWLMNEGGGGHVNDISENNNTGTINGASWANGQFGGCLSFNGTSNYLNVNNSSSLQLSGPLTLSGWVYTTAKQTTYDPIISKESGGGANSSYYLGLNDTGSGQIYFGFNGGGNEVDINAPSLKAWHLITGVFNGSNLKVYVDGSLAGTGGGSTTPNVNTSALRIGSYAGTPSFFNGRIDNVLIYNRALSAAEVQQLYVSPFCFMQQRKLVLAAAAATPPASGSFVFIGAFM